MGNWNTATDPGGLTIPYRFAPAPDAASAGIRVTAGTCSQGCTCYDPNTRTIRIDAGARDNSAASIEELMGHELGHPLGLANSTNGTTTQTSVMQGYTGDCDPITGRPQPNDVAQVGRHANDRTSCTETQPRRDDDNRICQDADGDGWCADNDCDDTDPYLHTNCPERCVRRACPPGWSWWWEFCECRLGHCPIVIDTSGDRYALTGNEDGVNFDLDNDGVAERLSWTSAGSDDAFLALDRDRNGAIDNGAELFGNFTEQPAAPPGEDMNGFLALAEFDKPEQGGNSDGVIDRRDAVFPNLRLWRDVNHNGVSEPDELRTLRGLGLKSIDLDYKESKRVDEHGNRFRYRVKVRDAKGAQVGRWAWDVFLVHAP